MSFQKKRAVDQFEVKWSAALCKELRDKHGFKTYSLSGDTKQEGWPDKLLIGFKGLLFLAEFKNVKTVLKPLQRVTLQAIEKRCPLTAIIVRKNDEFTDGGTIYSPDVVPKIRFELKSEFYESLKAYKSLEDSQSC